MNIQDSSNSSSSYFDPSTSDNHDISIATTTEESSSTLLHRLHTNERQLRTLAVILSLTGGLSLSFALGVGIMIYWYSRKCKQRRKLHGSSGMKDAQEDVEDDEKSCTTTNYSYCASCDMMVRDQQLEVTSDAQQHGDILFGNTTASIVTDIPPNNATTTAATSLVSSSSPSILPSSSASSTHRMEAIDLVHLPPPPLSHLTPTPEPSAPSAKELHHSHPSSSRSNQQPDNGGGNPVEQDGQEELCHDCLVPPPAYTKEL
ncbi:hypothetical protein MAM1_0273c09065 [Mucor ambiguus]|uniref:Uncharacterized protein n=1 Tax=Mucor ambiguus TaxID=91626 RepID=A0A0C9LX25_9FUNG|nr:hypothetical protein MAM1_0273c09065 [Mucor ambiguus]